MIVSRLPIIKHISSAYTLRIAVSLVSGCIVVVRARKDVFWRRQG